MDPYDGTVLGHRLDPQWEPIRRSMGFARRLAERVNLAAMTPLNALASTQYCLADPVSEYLVYLPKGGKATVDLSKAGLSSPSNGWIAQPASPVTAGRWMGERSTSLHRLLHTIPSCIWLPGPDS